MAIVYFILCYRHSLEKVMDIQVMWHFVQVYLLIFPVISLDLIS